MTKITLLQNTFPESRLILQIKKLILGHQSSIEDFKPYHFPRFSLLKNRYFSTYKGMFLFFSLLFIFQWGNAQIIGPGDWSSVRLYGHAYDIEDFSKEEYDFIANHFYYFTIEKRHAREIYGATSSERASAATAAKIVANNSNTHPLFYWNTKVVYDEIYETVQDSIAANPDWASGKNGGGNWTDTAYASEEFRTWFVDVVEDMVNNYAHEGTFLDAALSVGGHISPTAGAYLKDMMAEMPGPTIFNGFGPNTPYARFDYLETAEGVFLEHFFKTQCDNLAKGKKMLDDLLLVPNEKIIIANAGPEAFWNTTDHKFSLAAFLIIANDNSYYHWMPSANNWSSDHLMFWDEEMPSANNWSSDHLMFWDEDFGKYLGPPLGPASVNGYVYTREFDNASIDLETKPLWTGSP
ncbi:putative glycoside hydrolase [uncultured Polaribacter sp.]|uniref:putative glycoside hydrolase n=1 Tax=uncultured Polaribacter sp. TaxID=174711 RepID=UPI002610BD80|nr:putative glycoside hydrolase [uncultured Polaribacter sp.]